MPRKLILLACAAALAALLGLGCSGSDNAATHDAAAVESTLAKHGFDVRVVFDRKAGERPDGSILGLLNLYTPLEDITALVADTSSDGAIGSVISAWVFDVRLTPIGSSLMQRCGFRRETSSFSLMTRTGGLRTPRSMISTSGSGLGEGPIPWGARTARRRRLRRRRGPLARQIPRLEAFD